MTRRSRGIHAAWHFWYAASFGGESGLRKVGLGGTHPLTRRYVLCWKWIWKSQSGVSKQKALRTKVYSRLCLESTYLDSQLS
ncbi:TPA: DUF3265 domain-containing protein [Vibrio vulnificus]|nr:DUF3265 domain-containing protein [Vibrio vulnificus]